MAIINNDFHDVLTGRHSVRRFDPSVKISREEMTEMLKETITICMQLTGLEICGC